MFYAVLEGTISDTIIGDLITHHPMHLNLLDIKHETSNNKVRKYDV